ncbi:hypothetical protein RJ639_029396 [Escallonia herrerae]|uniref:YbaK/aminoacyl-tRNA synthetase-associated domain-containing protein n=1 Tax=Escallonia herrerae TaxID=1293975 RepID=A0AA88XD30_9ASTE|nr:hypothetical protein RJ639_029396 [Escallonia herrerae]
MGFTKEQLLARLKELQIEFAGIEHSVVLTVEDQDKKHRLYLVSALADTKVDLKVLSQRLGLGKGGLRMAPNEALLEILKRSNGRDMEAGMAPFLAMGSSSANNSFDDHHHKAQHQNTTHQSEWQPLYCRNT